MGLQLDKIDMRNSRSEMRIADMRSLSRHMRISHSEMRIADMGSLSRQNRYENFSFRNEKCQDGVSVYEIKG